MQSVQPFGWVLGPLLHQNCHCSWEEEMGSAAAAKKHFQGGHSGWQQPCEGGHRRMSWWWGVFGRDLGAWQRAELWGAEELEEPGLGSGGSHAGLRPGCQPGKRWKLQGVRGLEKGLQRVRRWTLAHKVSASSVWLHI